MATIFIAFFIACMVYYITGQSCTYADIDLSALGNTFVECAYNDQYKMEYQACGNNVVCQCDSCPYEGQSYLAMMIDEFEGNSCYYLASNNDIVTGESLQVNGLNAYKLQYTNGIQIPCDAPRKLNITFVCDSLVYNSALTSCGEPVPCNYELQIHTNAACDLQFCSYNTPNGYSIDLSSLNGQIFGSADTVYPFNYLYGYTPCQNGYTCNSAINGNNKYIRQDLMKYGNSKLKYNITNKYNNTYNNNVMLYRENINTLQCDKILGYFNTIVPDYNTAEQYFEFIYEVPNQCNGEPSVTFVKWYCNPNVINANITYATNITTCAYEIKIDSRLAC